MAVVVVTMAAGRGGLDRGCVRRKRSWTRGLWAKGGDNRRGGGRGPLPGGAAHSGQRRWSGPLQRQWQLNSFGQAALRQRRNGMARRRSFQPLPNGAATAALQRRCDGAARSAWPRCDGAARRRWSWPLSGCAAMTARWRGAFGRAALRRRRDGAARRRWSGPYPGARRVQPDGSATAAQRRGATALVPAQIIASSYCHYRIGNINGSKYVIK